MNIELLGTVFFVISFLHILSVSGFAKLAHRFAKGSAREAFFHLMSEVEVVFGFWAFVFLAVWSAIEGPKVAIEYQESLNMTEPLFIFCIMIMASSRPVITMARKFILFLCVAAEKVLRVPTVLIQFFMLMFIGPLLGSFITEPAAITIVALLLYRMIDENKIDSQLIYGIIAVLFVNVSVGGALTHFAAPPILMVARVWNWGFLDVFTVLGEPAVLSVFINTMLFTIVFRKKMTTMLRPLEADSYPMPRWVIISHLVLLVSVVATAHYPQAFFGIFLIFIGLTTVTKTFQDQLKFKEALLVAFFLAGLMVFGPFQKWWLEPLINGLGELTLFASAIGLTAITDNAALTFLGSQIPTLSDLSKWALVGGALVGGGLTILANAPNPAGFAILSSKFPDGSLNAIKLLKAALLPTVIAAICFYVKIFLIFRLD